MSEAVDACKFVLKMLEEHECMFQCHPDFDFGSATGTLKQAIAASRKSDPTGRVLIKYDCPDADMGRILRLLAESPTGSIIRVPDAAEIAVITPELVAMATRAMQWAFDAGQLSDEDRAAWEAATGLDVMNPPAPIA